MVGMVESASVAGQKPVGTAGRARWKLEAERQTRPAGDKHPAMQRSMLRHAEC